MKSNTCIKRRSRLLMLAALSVLISITACSDQTQDQLQSSYIILYAFDAEGELLAENMTVRETDTILGRPAHVGQLSGKEIVLAESGVGMTNAAMILQRLIDLYRPKGVIFSGIAGALDSSVRIGDIVVCQKWQTHDYGYNGKDGFTATGIAVYDASIDSVSNCTHFDVDSSYFAIAEDLTDQEFSLANIDGRDPKLIVGGVGVSGNCFIDSREKRIWLQEKFNALITDMESAAVGQVCLANDLPYIVFRSSSDLAGGSGSETAGDELERFFNIAADNSSTIVMRFLSEL